MYRKLLMKQMSPDFPSLVYAAVLAELYHVDGIELGRIHSRRSPADIETIKQLRKQNVQLTEMNVRLKNICKRHVEEKNNEKNKRKPEENSSFSIARPAQKRRKERSAASRFMTGE